jgi:sensor histidine kinase YesM
VRMGARLSYALHLPDELRGTLVPPMLLQPLVENAIKHGLEPKIDGGHIEVHATAAAGILTLTVADTGLGLDAAIDGAADSSGGIGAANVRERLRALYGTRAAFSLTANAPSGVLARLSIPL